MKRKSLTDSIWTHALVWIAIGVAGYLAAGMSLRVVIGVTLATVVATQDVLLMFVREITRFLYEMAVILKAANEEDEEGAQ